MLLANNTMPDQTVDLNAQETTEVDLPPPSFDAYSDDAPMDIKAKEDKPDASAEKKEPENKPVDDPSKKPVEDLLANKPEDKPIQELPKFGKQKKERDYTGIDEADLPIFQGMEKYASNKSFEDAKKFYLERNTLKKQVQDLEEKVKQRAEGQLPENYYSNPNAYILAPEYHKLQDVSTKYEHILDFWQTQLDAVNEGGQWRDIDYDAKSGKFIYSEPKDATAETKQAIRQHIRHAEGNYQKAKLSHDNFVNTFAQRHQQETESIVKMKDSFFKDWDKADHPTQKMQKEYMEGIPKSFRSNPLADLVVKGRVMMSLAHARIQELEKQLGIQTQQKKDEATRLPSKDRFQPASNGTRKTTMADFEKAEMGI